ncbi:MAG TPA: outer membrane beta-barrel protein [Nitrospira sp.]|nr:outer membrane beta-barrel protein [Nitrospira sp.]
MWRRAFVCLLAGWLSTAGFAWATEFGDIDLSVYALGSWPRDRGIFDQGSTVDASIKQSYGAGIRIGLFPNFTNRFLGMEIDSFGHGGALSFPHQSNGQNDGTNRSNLLFLNTMLNLVLRYPGETVRPYIGIGAGWSHAMLLNPNIIGRNDKDFDAARALGWQYLAGLQVTLTPKVFLFGEYRYFSANYHWAGLALDFRSHYGAVGAGLRF